MDEEKLKKLKKMGGRVTTVKEFLGLSDSESEIVEAKVQASTVRNKVRKYNDQT